MTPEGRATQEATGQETHKHEFSALWWHFGRYGRQDVHVHDCFEEGCDVHVIGAGRKCSGKKADHHREVYDESREEWVRP